MKIEASPSADQIKWLLVLLCIAAGIGHEQLLGML